MKARAKLATDVDCSYTGLADYSFESYVLVMNHNGKKLQKQKENDVNEDVANRAAAICNIKPTTLYFRVKKYKETLMPKNINCSNIHLVSTNDKELMLEMYFLKMSRMSYGFTYSQGRELDINMQQR
ncbi:hypothetical protein HHI36_013043 [Cryptolaemus montrouzieri]|uniref:HTH psq-type domain-containing protein n=1 Tax=Cryptolaemus montrouzieri TaxID=559131 RepID=A0ABD2NG00_9CUCU